MRFCYYGLVRFERALELQKQAWMQTLQDGEARILGFEHPAVVTLGKRGQPEKDITSLNATPVFEVDRGGQATLHSQGQLVIYPIVHLVKENWGVRSFVDLLHNISIQTLQNYGVQANTSLNSGLFTKAGKIAFVGLRVDKGVTRHGLAINVNNNLDLFSQIRSCGVDSARVDSVAQNGVKIHCRELFESWIRAYGQWEKAAKTLSNSKVTDNPVSHSVHL